VSQERGISLVGEAMAPFVALGAVMDRIGVESVAGKILALDGLEGAKHNQDEAEEDALRPGAIPDRMNEEV